MLCVIVYFHKKEKKINWGLDIGETHPWGLAQVARGLVGISKLPGSIPNKGKIDIIKPIFVYTSS